MNTNWSLTIEEAFLTAGDGVAAIGRIDGVIPAPAGGPAVICVDGAHRHIEYASAQMLDRVRNGQREGLPALLLRQVSIEQVTIGAIIHSVGEACPATAH